MPHPEGVILSLAKFNKILKVDAAAGTATVQCGVRNAAISEAAAVMACTTPPTRAARSPAPSAAMSRKIRAECIA